MSKMSTEIEVVNADIFLSRFAITLLSISTVIGFIKMNQYPELWSMLILATGNAILFSYTAVIPDLLIKKRRLKEQEDTRHYMPTKKIKFYMLTMMMLMTMVLAWLLYFAFIVEPTEEMTAPKVTYELQNKSS